MKTILSNLAARSRAFLQRLVRLPGLMWYDVSMRSLDGLAIMALACVIGVPALAVMALLGWLAGLAADRPWSKDSLPVGAALLMLMIAFAAVVAYVMRKWRETSKPNAGTQTRAGGHSNG